MHHCLICFSSCVAAVVVVTDRCRTPERRRHGCTLLIALQYAHLIHHFGMPHLFLTVTFDDDTSFLLQVLSDVPIDSDDDIASLSTETLLQRAKQRTDLRISFPGLSALHFEMLYDILVEEVIGWDIRKKQSMPNAGHFGIPFAFASTIEEQGTSQRSCKSRVHLQSPRAPSGTWQAFSFACKGEATLARTRDGSTSCGPCQW